MNTWTFDPFALALMALASIAYTLLVRGKKTNARPLLFAAAIVTMIVALLSPVAFLARGVLFSAHMFQHLLLVLVVPPLVLLSLPHEAANHDGEKRVEGSAALRYIPAWGLGVGAMWLWHAPTLCNAASRDPMMLRAQTISLLVMGIAFFRPIFGTRAAQRLTTFGAMAYLFTACAACTVLGVAITFSPVEVCSVFAQSHTMPWGFTPRTDQELGGLLMWVPGCLVYAGCIVFMYGRYARAERVSIKESHDVAG